MERFSVTPETHLKTPQEEIDFLRARLSELEQSFRVAERPASEAAPHLIREYQKHAPDTALAKGHRMIQPEIDAVVLDLAPETHDAQMSELLSVMRERGIRNALSVVEGLDNPHVEDDFHRFLSEYLKEGYESKGIPENGPLFRALHMSLFEITLPFSEKKESDRPLKELLSSMEQLYAGLCSIAAEEKTKEKHFTLEIAVENHKEHVALYCAVPSEKKELFERQVLSIFPHAHLSETKNDYNIFAPGGMTAASVAELARSPAYPIKTYDAFDYDPFNITLSAFAKIAKTGEGAAIQILIRPTENDYTEKFNKAIERIKKGTSAKEATEELSLAKDLAGGFKDFFSSTKKKDDTKKDEPTVDEAAIEQIRAKIAHPIADASVRLIVSAETEKRASALLTDLEATFSQFNIPSGNALRFKRQKGKALKNHARDFSFRLFSSSESFPANFRELATLFHLPVGNTDSSRELKRTSARNAPAPIDIPSEGVVLGANRYRGVETLVHIDTEDRLRHLYVIGQTGTGKTTLLKNMIVQDIKNGDGVCMLDPHGSDILDVLASVPPERAKDVIYFDPSNTDYVMGLNMLDYDRSRPEQKTFVVNELFSIFQKLYGAVPESMGPMFEQYFRNATMLVIDDPDSGNTLFDVSRVLSNKEYRALKLSRCTNPVVVQFWREVAEKAGGEGALANIVPYITSKFDVFLANDIMRPIIVQRTSAFDFRDIMDNKKILLVNLAKGRLGDINAHLLGLIIVGKILMAALSRADAGGTSYPPFYLYIDEFQNVTTDSIATILSEARKYKLSLTVAHQFIKQLDEKIRDAVFGNVGSLAAFRVGSDDAEYLEKYFTPVFSANDLMNVDNRIALMRLLVRGRPERPFTLETIPPAERDVRRAETLMQESAKRYGRPRAEVESELTSSHVLNLAA